MNPTKINAETKTYTRTVPITPRVSQKEQILLNRVKLNPILEKFNPVVFKELYKQDIKKTKDLIESINRNFSTIETILNRYPDSEQKRRTIEIFNITTTARNDLKYLNSDAYTDIRLKLKCMLGDELLDHAFTMTGKKRDTIMDYDENSFLEKRFLEDSYSLISYYLAPGKDNIIETFFNKPNDIELSTEEWEKYVKDLTLQSTDEIWNTYREKIRTNLITLYKIKTKDEFTKLDTTMNELDRFVTIYLQVAKYLVTLEKGIGSPFGNVISSIIAILLLVLCCSMVGITSTESRNQCSYKPCFSLNKETKSIWINNSNHTEFFSLATEPLSHLTDIHGKPVKGYRSFHATVEEVQSTQTPIIKESIENLRNMNVAIKNSVSYTNVLKMCINIRESRSTNAVVDINNSKFATALYEYARERSVVSARMTTDPNFESIADMTVDFKYSLEHLDDRDQFVVDLKTALEILGLEFREQDVESIWQSYLILVDQSNEEYIAHLSVITSSEIKSRNQLEDTIRNIYGNYTDLINAYTIKTGTTSNIADTIYQSSRTIKDSVINGIEYAKESLSFTGYIMSGLTSPFTDSLSHLTKTIKGTRALSYIYEIGKEITIKAQPLAAVVPEHAKNVFKNTFYDYFFTFIQQISWITAMTGISYGMEGLIDKYFNSPVNRVVQWIMSTLKFAGFTFFNILKSTIIVNLTIEWLLYLATFQPYITDSNFLDIFRVNDSPSVALTIGSSIAIIRMIWPYISSLIKTRTGPARESLSLGFSEYIKNVPGLGRFIAKNNIYKLEMLADGLLPLYYKLDLPKQEEFLGFLVSYRGDRNRTPVNAMSKIMNNMEKLLGQKGEPESYKNFKDKLESYEGLNKRELILTLLFKCITIRYTFVQYGSDLEDKNLEEKIFIFSLAKYFEDWLSMPVLIDKDFKNDRFFGIIADVYIEAVSYPDRFRTLADDMSNIYLGSDRKYITLYTEYVNRRKSRGVSILTSVSFLPFTNDTNGFFYFNNNSVYEDKTPIEKVKDSMDNKYITISKFAWTAVAIGLLWTSGYIQSIKDTRELNQKLSIFKHDREILINTLQGRQSTYGSQAVEQSSQNGFLFGVGGIFSEGMGPAAWANLVSEGVTLVAKELKSDFLDSDTINSMFIAGKTSYNYRGYVTSDIDMYYSLTRYDLEKLNKLRNENVAIEIGNDMLTMSTISKENIAPMLELLKDLTGKEMSDIVASTNVGKRVSENALVSIYNYILYNGMEALRSIATETINIISGKEAAQKFAENIKEKIDQYELGQTQTPNLNPDPNLNRIGDEISEIASDERNLYTIISNKIPPDVTSIVFNAIRMQEELEPHYDLEERLRELGNEAIGIIIELWKEYNEISYVEDMDLSGYSRYDLNQYKTSLNRKIQSLTNILIKTEKETKVLIEREKTSTDKRNIRDNIQFLNELKISTKTKKDSMVRTIEKIDARLNIL